jgi:predicted transcriptional regulator with HTH domain
MKKKEKKKRIAAVYFYLYYIYFLKEYISQVKRELQDGLFRVQIVTGK